MNQNIVNAIHRIQEARTAIFVETGNVKDDDDKEEKLEDIQELINRVEVLIKEYDDAA